MPRFYKKEELDKIKKLEMEILRDFLKICKENNLRYFGMAGTCLGAVRHGGFIPWDDDIDIGMPREDYEKFLKIARESYNERYYILNADTCREYPLMNTRWCIKGTRFVEYAFKDVKNCPFGIFLDIFPYDNLAESRISRFAQQWSAWFYNKLMILSVIPEPYIAQGGILKKIILFICSGVHKMLGIMKIDTAKLYAQCRKICLKYAGKKTDMIGYICDTSPHMEENCVKDIFPCIQLKFEDIMLEFPKNTDLILKQAYGDGYMTLPPVNKRKTHYPYILEFGDNNNKNKRQENTI